jgi:hypothetical protein
MRPLSLEVVISLAALFAMTPGARADVASESQEWVKQASVGLDSRALDALSRIGGAERRLLALRAYLRAGDTLGARWSWKQQQISSYAASDEGKAAAAEIDAIIAAFEAANPGFSLHVNREPRSLELQIARWNENRSVGATAAELEAALSRKFSGQHDTRAEDLRDFLIRWMPSSAATLAAPGLSAHGQARAFDFQVARGEDIVANTEAATARSRWDAAGWTEKLCAAVSAASRRAADENAAGAHFEGPLQAPYEPWHYRYVPGGNAR